MTTSYDSLIADLEMCKSIYQSRADELEAEYKLTGDEKVFEEFEHCYEKIWQIGGEIRQYSKFSVKPLVRRIKRFTTFYKK